MRGLQEGRESQTGGSGVPPHTCQDGAWALWDTQLASPQMSPRAGQAEGMWARPYPGLLATLCVGVRWGQLLRPQWGLCRGLVSSQSLQSNTQELKTLSSQRKPRGTEQAPHPDP